MENGEGTQNTGGPAGGFAFFGSDEGFFELFDDWDCFDGFEGRNPKRRPGRKKLQLRSAFFIAHAHAYAHLCVCVCTVRPLAAVRLTANIQSKGTERPCGNGNGQ